MMLSRNSCNRCGRTHSGICGIPKYSTMRNPGIAKRSPNEFNSSPVASRGHGRNKSPLLAHLWALAEAQEKLGTAITNIKQVRDDDPRYEELFYDLEHWLDRITVLKMGG